MEQLKSLENDLCIHQQVVEASKEAMGFGRDAIFTIDEMTSLDNPIYIFVHG
jgi:hypothetical protein